VIADAATAPPAPPGVSGDELATAVPIVGLALLVFNDAVLKLHWPGVISGKLSDFAVVLYFPFLVTASFAVFTQPVRLLLARLRERPAPGPVRLTRPRLLLGMAITSFALAAVNLSPGARDLYLRLLDLLDLFRLMPSKGYVVDPTDLIGLTMLPVTWWWGNRLIQTRPGASVS
jgi:hypothetical protein